MTDFLKNVKWIFFDVGSTLVDESEAYDRRAREMLAGTGITFKEFDEARITLAKSGLDGNSAAIKHFGLTKTPWHSEDELPYLDAYSLLKTLSERGYRLGVIANQNVGLAERLEKWGLLKFLDVVVSSAEVGCAKPDRKIFETALEYADCDPRECLMVGDRLDNDIKPAKALGMKTLWVKGGLAKYQDSMLGDGAADFQADSLSKILELL